MFKKLLWMEEFIPLEPSVSWDLWVKAIVNMKSRLKKDNSERGEGVGQSCVDAYALNPKCPISLSWLAQTFLCCNVNMVGSHSSFTKSLLSVGREYLDSYGKTMEGLMLTNLSAHLFFFGDWTRLPYFVVLLWWVLTPHSQGVCQNSLLLLTASCS